MMWVFYYRNGGVMGRDSGVKKASPVISEEQQLGEILERVMTEFDENKQYFQAMEIFVKMRMSYRDFERRVSDYPDLRSKMNVLEEMEEARIIEKGMMRKGDPYMSQFILERKYGYNEPRKKMKSTRDLVEDMISDVASRRSVAGGKFAEQRDAFEELTEGGEEEYDDENSIEPPYDGSEDDGFEEENKHGQEIELAEDDYDELEDQQARLVAKNKTTKR
jgi:hypothetical protein